MSRNQRRPLAALLTAALALTTLVGLPNSTPTAQAAETIGWSDDLGDLSSSASVQSIRCPELGFSSFDAVWGTNTYDDNSGICTAAVHAGVLNPDLGGTFTIEVVPGIGDYIGTTRNGVATRTAGGTGPAFAFVNGTTEPGTISWTREADGLDPGVYSFRCPSLGFSSFDIVYGTNTYDDDSGICTAAVHAGRISSGSGGVVTFEVVPGIGTYTGTTRNGVTTRNCSCSGPAFVFVSQTPRQTTVTAIAQAPPRQTTVSPINIPATPRSGLNKLTSTVPARLLDTRSNGQTVDGNNQANGIRPADSTIQLDVTGRGGIANDASTVIVNITAIRPTGPGFVTIYPCGEPRPTASNLNYGPGDVIANLVLAKVGNNGRICIYTSAQAHLVADVNGSA